MHPQLYFLFQLFLAMSLPIEISPRVEFTNFVCTSLNKNFGEFEYCFLKSVNRTYKYASMKLIVYEKPVTNAKMNFAVYKRANGYKPFLYNVSMDACKFFRSQNSNMVTKYFYDFIKDVSNLNHSCPYNEDFFLEKLSIDMVNQRVTRMLPFPEGDYLFDVIWSTNNKWAVAFKLHLQLKN